MKPIKPMTVLPGYRSDIDLVTMDGLTLVGELALPRERKPEATLICLHPLPTHGGYMDSHVFRKIAWRLPALADLAVLRFNFRGVTSARGTSQGSFGAGEAELMDAAAAVDFAVQKHLPKRWLVGWSFGTEIALRYGPDPAIEGAILLSPPLRGVSEADLQRWNHAGKPIVALVPEHDDFLRPAAARERFAAVDSARVIGVEGAKHLWMGEQFVRQVLDIIVATVNPLTPTPLPRQWEHDLDRA